ncbi:rho guanine nucleotide exchange factor 26 isoform X2 [Salmo salar]|uniref:Rho guanine nucleotide exchange factor 26 isoform X2 n=1 Tax=Salmo salar TaxID=8030 RepID=A0ABM3DMG5_SALSA|nr:rho guanine nucleotide exchange factor 26-like isoform X2 [Salmo salar]
MEGGNDVDLSNSNITPLWKRRSANHTGPSKLKARPLSYQIDGVHMTDFPVEDSKCSFTLSQPAETLVATPGGGTVILKHVLNQPTRKTRVVRSISIGHLSKGHFSLSKFKSEDDKSLSLNSKPCHGGSVDNVWSDKPLLDTQNRLSSPFTLTAHRDQIVFGTSPSPPDSASSNHPSPPASPNNNHHHNQSSPSSYHPLTPVPSPPNPSPSPPSLHTPTPSHSSTSSIHSLSSLISTPSDPPTPHSPSSADMSAPFPSPSHSPTPTFSSSPTPTLSPSISLSPPPSIVLSTHSAAALKMGTQQLIPKGLASLSKASPAGVQSHGMGGLLGLDPTKRALRALSMVETGSFFSTGIGSGGGGTDQDESPGTLKRGLRSTSYRRAVVSGVEMEIPPVDPKSHRLSQPVDPKSHRLSQPVDPKSHRLSQPVDPKSHRLSQPVDPKSHRLSQPVDPKSHRLSQPVDPKSHRLSQPVDPKSHRLSQPVDPKSHRLSQPVDPKSHRLSQPVDPKSHRLSQPVDPKSHRLSQPVDPKSHRLSQPVDPKSHRLSQPVDPKSHRLSQPVDPKSHRLSQPVDPKSHRLSQPVDPKSHRLSQPVDPKSHRLSQPVDPKSHRLSQPVDPKSHRLSQPVDPKSHRLSQPVDPKSHRLSQPVLKGLQEVKERPTSPGKKNKSPDKKPVLITQRTFDSEEEELYQNYQEKALHNDSDEDQSREAKPDDRIVMQYRPIRTSWSQLSVVKKSGVSDKLSQEERKRQEAIFELISSEHSYLHSLEVLIRMFQNSAELSDTMTKTEHHHLFSNITDVCEASKKFFKDLEDIHQQNVVIDDISDIVFRHAQSNFDPYITYCSNEVYQQRTLQRLVSKSPVFKEVLTRIEGHPDCRNLPMISFLILPMQRVTRLPLLMDVICQKAPKDSAQYETCKKALQSVSKVVRKCNEGARTMERTEMMYTINSQLDFKIKPFPLVSSSRWMVKRGELTAFVEENGIFSKKTSRQQVYFFLFNDVLILTRKKSEDSYAVIDYALRGQIWVGPCQAEDVNLSPVRSTSGMLTSRQPGASHLFRLRFRSNHSGDKVPMVLGVELMNERARWISALGQSSNDEKNQDRTNAMQVEVTRTYTAKQPDELSLQVADVVLVSQTVEDGWYEGERLRDGERGWFLSECAEPIMCQATIERNMQRMDRLQGLETNV